MNILLVGGTCSLMNNIILKLRKEGHRVFLLTGDKYKHNKYEKVFERYDFPYDSENLNEVIESVNPDVTILLGAFDTNYLWNGEERETVHFISHMVNILVAYSVVNRGKLIYLSSVIYALSDFLIMILSWLVKQSLRAFSFQEVQP